MYPQRFLIGFGSFSDAASNQGQGRGPWPGWWFTIRFCTAAQSFGVVFGGCYRVARAAKIFARFSQRFSQHGVIEQKKSVGFASTKNTKRNTLTNKPVLARNTV